MTEPTSLPLPRCARLLAFGALGLAFVAHGASFELKEGTHDGGGQHSQGERFALEGSIGQPDASQTTSAHFSIDGGFWRPAIAPVANTIFSNGFED